MVTHIKFISQQLEPSGSALLLLPHWMASIKLYSNSCVLSSEKRCLPFYSVERMSSRPSSNSGIKQYSFTVFSSTSSTSFILQSLLSPRLSLLGHANTRYICQLLPVFPIFMRVRVWQQHHLALDVSGHFSRCSKTV